MYLDKQHPQPVYLQLKQMLQRQIEQGYYLSHQKLPSERDLCQHHNLSRMTARKALQALIADGLAYTSAGKGTFVSGASQATGTNFNSSSYNDDLCINNRIYREKLIVPLLAFDAVAVEQAIADMLSSFSIETVASQLFPAIIADLEQQWHTGRVSLPAQNYAIVTLRSHLIGMVNATLMPQTGPKVLLGCASGDQHEIGLLLLALGLRRRGYSVIYMGPNFTPTELDWVVKRATPQVVCLSAATDLAAASVNPVAEQVGGKLSARAGKSSERQPYFTFAGVAFTRNPRLIPQTACIYLGNTVQQAVTTIQQLAPHPA